MTEAMELPQRPSGPAEARSILPTGGAEPQTKTCRICAEEIAFAALKCNECDSYYGWRRFVPASQVTLSLLIALISIIATVGPAVKKLLFPHSHTSVTIIDGNSKDLLLSVTNSGYRPAVLREFEIEFEDIDLIAASPPAIIAKEQSLVAAEKSHVVELRVTLKPTNGKTKEAALTEDELAEGKMTVRAKVKESNSEGERDLETKTDRISTKHLRTWLTAATTG